MTYPTVAVRTVPTTFFTTVPTMGRAALCALLGLCLWAGLTSRARAATASSYVVTRTADDTAPGSLRAAIAQVAGTGGTVTFAIPNTDPGYSSTANTDTITLTAGELMVTGSLTIAGPAAPATTVVISGAPPVSGQQSANASRVFSVTGGTVVFSNLTVTNGSPSPYSIPFPEPGGGGDILNTATLTLTGCTVTGGGGPFITGDGAGINNGSGASLTMIGCTVSGNSGSSASGGGIANSGTLTATGCLISGNNVGGNGSVSGGGLVNSGTATLNSCTLSGNGATSFFAGTVFGDGGGASNTGSLTLNNSLVANNFSIYGGGLSNNTGGTLTLSACTLSGNSSVNYRPFGRNANAGYGGGVINSGTASITDCLVVGNGSDNGGGMDNGGTLTLINSTFTGNVGGTIFGGSPPPVSECLLSGPARLVNDIFYGDAGAEISAGGTAGPTVTYSDVQGGYTGAGNINMDPQFVRNPGTNGSGDPGDEHLRLTSPAIHVGTNGPGVPLTDIEGTVRPVLPARPSMGAYEIPGTAGGFNIQGQFLVAGTQNVSTGTQVVAKFLPGTTPAASFAASVSLGDGSVVVGTIIPDPTTAGVFDVTVSHTYIAYGMFIVTTTVSGPNNTPAGTVTSTANILPAQVATDVTSQVSVFRGGFYYNRFTKRYSQTVTITNTGAAAISGPLSLALDNLTAVAAAVGAAGTTQYAPGPAGSPYVTVQTGSLAAGATTSVLLQLTNTGSSQIDYTPRILAGPGAR